MPNLPAVFREYKRLERIRDEQGFSLKDLERWTLLKRILSEHFRPGLGREIADKQASLRVPVRLRVAFGDRGALRECLMTNISRGGVFIATDDPLPIGTSLQLRIHVGESERTLEIAGEIVTVNTGADMKSSERGMGITFTTRSEADESLVKELYGKAMEDADLGSEVKP
jgi:uncharacterized protein (TIGR02266 family)